MKRRTFIMGIAACLLAPVSKAFGFDEIENGNVYTLENNYDEFDSSPNNPRRALRERKFCPQCQEEGLKSQVYMGVCTSTLVGCLSYWDEDGNFHSDDCNTTICTYYCSNGHTWNDGSWANF